jgi:DNA-binding MarR family transcriptional regulator
MTARRHEWSESHDREIMPLMLSLHQAQGRAFAQARAVWTSYGLTPAEFDVLATLRNAPLPHELTPSQLQESVLITSGGLTKVMRQLEARKLVTRSQREVDQRIKPVKLAQSGKRLVEKAMAELVAASGKQVRDVLDAREIAVLTQLLRKWVEAGDVRAK